MRTAKKRTVTAILRAGTVTALFGFFFTTGTRAAGLSESDVFEWWDDGTIAAEKANEILSLLDEGDLQQACALAEIYAGQACDGDSLSGSDATPDGGEPDEWCGTESRKKESRIGEARRRETGSTQSRGKKARGKSAGECSAKNATRDKDRGKTSGAPPKYSGHFVIKVRVDSTGKISRHREELRFSFHKFTLLLGSREILTYRSKRAEAHFGQITTGELHFPVPLDTLWGTAAGMSFGKVRPAFLLDTSGTASLQLTAGPFKKVSATVAYWRATPSAGSGNGTEAAEGTLPATGIPAGDARGLVAGRARTLAAVGAREVIEGDTRGIPVGALSTAGTVNQGDSGNGSAAETGTESTGADSQTSPVHSAALSLSFPGGRVAAWYQAGQAAPLVYFRLHGKDSSAISWRASGFFHGSDIPRLARLSKSIATHRFWITEGITFRARDFYDTKVTAGARIASPIESDSVSARFSLDMEGGPEFLRLVTKSICKEASDGCRESTHQARLNSAHRTGNWTTTISAAAKGAYDRKESSWGRPRLEIAASIAESLPEKRENLFKVALVAPDTRPGQKLQVRSEARFAGKFLEFSLSATFKKTDGKKMRPAHASISSKIIF